MVMWALSNSLGGEYLYPKSPAIESLTLQRQSDQAARNQSWESDREKIHEEMITSSDSFTTIDLGQYFAILPSDGMTPETLRRSGKRFQRC